MTEAYGKSTTRVILYNPNLQFHREVVELIYTKQLVLHSCHKNVLYGLPYNITTERGDQFL